MMEKLKWGVLGVSKHFKLRVFPPLLKNSKNQILAIASRNGEKARNAAERLGIEKAYGSYREVLNDDDIDAVYIPLPNSSHLEWIEKTAEAGKHILCEKPLTLNVRDTEKAFRTADERGVYLMEAFMFQFHPMWIKVKELIWKGEIGELRALQTFFTYNNPNPDNIRNKTDLGGGAIRDIGCYGIAFAQFISDENPRRAVSLMETDPDFGVDNLSSFTLEYENFHSLCTVATRSWPEQRVRILGTGGLIDIPLPFNIFPDVVSEIIVKNSVGERRISIEPADMYGCQFDAFAEAVERKDKAFFTKRAAFSTGIQTIMDGVFKSAEEKTWIDINFH